MNNSTKRKQKDVLALMKTNFEVKLENENDLSVFTVKFHGPADTPYEGGVWDVRVQLPDQYPFKSPSIGFLNRIYHPNIEFSSGAVCLDVINQAWSPMFEIKHVFEVFLPQLLLYPNPSDPLNREAANLLSSNKNQYDLIVKKFVQQYAKPKNQDSKIHENTNESNKKEEISAEVTVSDISDLSDDPDSLYDSMYGSTNRSNLN
ncbi:ubiquitin-conjugating enzyme e2 h [Anaeramoeba ignava]|uniref:Ubiquitin-conjugating enzyme E2 H n=1 Tax=Anaeramoeba ignava TaxID=1746090 RepID=A0A9Q0LPH4_ANAIG|nr:ubiquitin-conjugating enzyme e2 h [Anaeramoeba ignava]